MKFSRFFIILAIGSIGYCLTSIKNDPVETRKEKQCYVSKKKQKQQEPSEGAFLEKQQP